VAVEGAKAVPASKGLAVSDETQVPAGSPGIAPATSRPAAAAVPGDVEQAVVAADPHHLRVERRLADRVDRAVLFSAVELSIVRPPDSSWRCLAGSSVVRSGEIVCQESPRSDERWRYCEP
jgi:hypothetical protein